MRSRWTDSRVEELGPAPEAVRRVTALPIRLGPYAHWPAYFAFSRDGVARPHPFRVLSILQGVNGTRSVHLPSSRRRFLTTCALTPALRRQ
ncbi:hypothetical protein PYCCODRAFT_1434250 [Trametes coccinea BRFM310]|uniref:Uncharacterized protein n=1 Tax=Trametes coccinea (strain BRFM310) TaxID=1353009 RepID=A0A1Y2IRX3_TRAC3|nr:hypothetical protein PYCCODRAFT_1434250 [Trametes coccinea BRFM310]